MGQEIPKRRPLRFDAEVTKRVELLTPREREVMTGILAGLTNVQVGKALDISGRTVEVHRASIMDKIGVANTAQLVRVLTLAGF